MTGKILGITIIILAALTAGMSRAEDETMKKAAALFKPIPATAPENKENPVTQEKVELGKMLYFDPRLSASDLISCNTCHNMGTGGVDLQETSVGHKWQKGPRNAPTVLNSVFNIAQFWDGRAKDLEEQAKGPMQATVEMSNTPDRVIETLKSMPAYVDIFKNTFPGEADPVTFDNAVKAIEAFESTLLTPDSPFDKYIKGDAAALTDNQKAGLALFMDKGCAGCHNGINVGGGGYFPFGLVEKPADEIRPPGDKGRFTVTKTKSDEYVFKVPTLRNIALTAPYFHSGKVWDLHEAVRIMGEAQLGAKLTDEEVAKIVDFLGTLTGRQPEIVYPVLPPNGPDTPRPVLDIPGTTGKGK
ncbi:MAG TPA: cytochrome-c peroxidase [Thermodesulfobacteriota bacterium]|nr:cytochrome-c peroxidase [Thermodesulfobacteriota bacterium]